MTEFEGFRLDISRTERFLAPAGLGAKSASVAEAATLLEERKGPGADYLGWLDLPARLGAEIFDPLAASAARARQDSEVYVVIGIGGSYLGARAVLDALADRPGGGPGGQPGGGRGGQRGGQLSSQPDCPEVLFAGTGLCSVALAKLLRKIGDRDFRLCVISKSGTTLEPAIAFRILRERLIRKYGAREAAARITAVTDATKGALRRLATEEGYETYLIDDDIGGRFSVLTPVGLLPLAVAGVDVQALVAGAAQMRIACQHGQMRANPAHLYAATRHGLYERGYKTEILSTFHSGLQMFQEWWKQLFGESEGKDGRGIFPAATLFTTDLHSMGQYIQDGRRELLETFIAVKDGVPGVTVPAEPGEAENLDGLDYLVGQSLDAINWKAYEGVRKAHRMGGVPCICLEIDRLDARTMGGLIYFFEKAVAISGYLLEVNPFDQPGVEAYKQEMFRLLGKP